MLDAIAAWLISTGIADLFNLVVGKISTWFASEQAQKANDDAIDMETSAEAQAVLNATTPAQKDQTDHDILNGT